MMIDDYFGEKEKRFYPFEKSWELVPRDDLSGLHHICFIDQFQELWRYSGDSLGYLCIYINMYMYVFTMNEHMYINIRYYTNNIQYVCVYIYM